MIQFKKLGIIYEDSLNGRSYAAVETVEKIALERGFDVIRCFAESDIPDIHESERRYTGCFKQLLSQLDAVYLTVHGGMTENNLPNLVDMAVSNRIPTFSQSGSDDVKSGVLLSIFHKDFRAVGLFEAAILANVLNGALPRELTQIFEDSHNLAINLKTAEIIGFIPPVALLAAADEIYQAIAKDPNPQ